MRSLLGIEQFHNHNLRRTAATHMAEAGVALDTISRILNHRSAINTTVTSRVCIQHGYNPEKREALNAWGARLERIIAGTDGANVFNLPAARPTQPSE